MIATREESTPCSITHPTLSWPPFALVKAFKPIYPAVFALFLRSQVPSLIPAPAASYEWLEFTGHGRSYIVPSRACRSCLLFCRPMGLNFDTLQVPCVAEPGRLGTLSRFFGMHIAPSDYIVVVIVPGTYIVTYMMQIPIRVFIFVFCFCRGEKYRATAAGLQLGPHRYFTFEKDRTYLPSTRSKLILILRAKHQLDLRCTQGTDFPSIEALRCPPMALASTRST